VGPFDFWRGRRSFKPARGDRNPYGLLQSQPTQRHDLRHGCCVRAGNATRSEIENGSALGHGQGVEQADTRSSEGRAHRGVRVQVPPWLLDDCPGGETEIMAPSEGAGPGSTPGRGTDSGPPTTGTGPLKSQVLSPLWEDR